jgi:hypothetical protein
MLQGLLISSLGRKVLKRNPTQAYALLPVPQAFTTFLLHGYNGLVEAVDMMVEPLGEAFQEHHLVLTITDGMLQFST